ncbi:OLC1v1026302C1 [Oldenlandia corymbosa var. corymbosa]|uniref:Enhancer of polycomb-like protein n=1 Tax=Oldenlandia corymbosa var. corymbosa TaxID=529605 RepID=A0AAV1C774_OLDCO|nr:OLC1v1026302C1 [Oldenlandia corymbosa var. corymbosa]
MPSVGMRRSTRVFGARVLRSGRRLWSVKNNNAEWIELLDNSRDGGGDATKRKERGRQGNYAVPEQNIRDMDVDKKVVEPISENVVPEAVVANNHVGRRWGIVYTRKRKKVDSGVADILPSGDKKRFGKHFSRKKLKKKVEQKVPFKACHSDVCLVASEGSFDNPVPSLIVIVDISFCDWDLVSCLLSSVLRYIWRAKVGFLQLFPFLNSKTIGLSYSSRGIRFLKDSKLVCRGRCIIWGSCSSAPVFSVDYSVIPYCFMLLKSRMMLEFDRLACSIGHNVVDVVEEDEDDEATSHMCSGREVITETAVDILMAAAPTDCSRKIDLNTSTSSQKWCPNVMSKSEGLTKTGRALVDSLNLVRGQTEVPSFNDTSISEPSMQLRSGHYIQSRRSSRSKRGRRPTSLATRKTNSVSVSSLLSFRHNGTKVSPTKHNRQLRSSALRKKAAAQMNIAAKTTQVKSISEGLKSEVDLTSCSANVLVMDSEKGYRVEGAMISLELSAEKQWNLVIRKDGTHHFSLVVQKFMRPCSFNRFTQSVIWSTDNDWKLEFTNRQDWLVFKELYKIGSSRNAQEAAEMVIPVPGVHEVPGYVNNISVFLRPNSYISMKDDELSRALARRTTNYDMDSEDEEWLNKFNCEFREANPDQKLLSSEDFELAIDAFERGFFCNPDDFADECTTPQINLSLERRVIEAVHGFWIKKRKQKKSALVKVFQLYQRRRTQQLLPNSVLRKKRSFKRQGSFFGRGKQRPLLQAIAAEQGVWEQSAIVKVEEAKAAANRSEGLAVLKRQRAQQLMENADLATYKATMALKIAELARAVQSPDAVALLLPDL